LSVQLTNIVFYLNFCQLKSKTNSAKVAKGTYGQIKYETSETPRYPRFHLTTPTFPYSQHSLPQNPLSWF